MAEDSNKKDKNVDLNKVEEPITEYSADNEIAEDFELNKVLNQMLKIGLNQIELCQTKPHDQVMAEMKLKYNFK